VASISAFGFPATLEAESDILRYRHIRKERIGLEHHADIALVGLQIDSHPCRRR
jgi:hypothetical protein